MVASPWDEGSESVIRSEHISPLKSGDNIEAKRVALYGWDNSTSQWSRQSTTFGKLVPEKYDYIGATYPSGTTEVYTYKYGGSGGTLVATVTVVYTDSTKANISSVTRT